MRIAHKGGIISLSFAKLALGITRHKRFKFLYELERTQWQTREEIEKLQFQKLKKLLQHASINVPYYKSLFDRLRLIPEEIQTLEDFRKLPLLSKNDIIENLPLILARNYSRRNLMPNFTGGSTGVKLKFYNDRKANSFTKAISLRHTRWTGWDIGERQAQLWGSHYDIVSAKKFYSRLRNAFIHHNLMLSSYDMTEENMMEYRNRINQHKPQLITGYVSALYLFSSFLDERKLDIYSPKGIISSAETLYEHQREKIQSVFGCKVFNRYGCREVGNIAHECKEQSGLHMNCEHVLVEVLTEDGHPCKPGETGEIVVTDLDNLAFPFIRYKIEDIGLLADKSCPCGRGLPLLSKVEGRIWDVIVGANGNRLVGTFWLIENVRGIVQFQVLQKKFGEIVLKLVVNGLFTQEEKKKLIDRIYQKCGKDMRIEIQVVDKIPLTKSGKHRFIISEVSPFV